MREATQQEEGRIGGGIILSQTGHRWDGVEELVSCAQSRTRVWANLCLGAQRKCRCLCCKTKKKAHPWVWGQAGRCQWSRGGPRVIEDCLNVAQKVGGLRPSFPLRPLTRTGVFLAVLAQGQLPWGLLAAFPTQSPMDDCAPSTCEPRRMSQDGRTVSIKSLQSLCRHAQGKCASPETREQESPFSRGS